MLKMRSKTIKCPLCNNRYKSINLLIKHIETNHNDKLPPGFTGARYLYYAQTGKLSGSCIVCKSNTEWNEQTHKYNRYCNNPKCKENYKAMFNKRMIGKFGKVSLFDDPEHQRKMLANKKNSGKYKFRDGGEIEYVSSYELHFLKFLDTEMNYKSSDILGPSPHTYYYDYKNPNDREHEGRKFYIPDYYIPSLNLEIEIKQNTSTHPKIIKIDKVKEKFKDELMASNKEVNYIKIVDKKYDEFKKLLEDLKNSSIATEAYCIEELSNNDSTPVISDAKLYEVFNKIYPVLLDIHKEMIYGKYYGDKVKKAIDTLVFLSTKPFLEDGIIERYLTNIDYKNKTIIFDDKFNDLITALQIIETKDVYEDIPDTKYFTLSQLIGFLQEFRDTYINKFTCVVYKELNEIDSIPKEDIDLFAQKILDKLFYPETYRGGIL